MRCSTNYEIYFDTRWKDNEGSLEYETSRPQSKTNGEKTKNDNDNEYEKDNTFNEKPSLKLLFLGADLKHMFRTLFDTSEECNRVGNLFFVKENNSSLPKLKFNKSLNF